MLINCPTCGKPVSDTISECPHCKVALVKKEGKRYYNDLSYEEKLKLEKEYAEEHSCKTFTELKNSSKKQNKIGLAFMFISMLFSVLVIVLIIKYSNITNFSDIPIIGVASMFTSFGLFMLSAIVSIVFGVISKKLDKQYKFHFAGYKKWLNKKRIFDN